MLLTDFSTQFLPRCMECRRGLAMRKLSFCLSVRQTLELWQNGRKICPDFYTIRKIILPSFLRRRMVGGGDPSTWNFGSAGPRWSEITDFEPIFARSASAVIRSAKKVQLTLVGRPLRMILYVGDSLYLKYWIKVTALERNHRFSISFCS